jgi:hypothetical protein
MTRLVRWPVDLGRGPLLPRNWLTGSPQSRCGRVALFSQPRPAPGATRGEGQRLAERTRPELRLGRIGAVGARELLDHPNAKCNQRAPIRITSAGTRTRRKACHAPVPGAVWTAAASRLKTSPPLLPDLRPDFTDSAGRRGEWTQHGRQRSLERPNQHGLANWQRRGGVCSGLIQTSTP